MLESDLSEPVCCWLKDRGLVPYCEVPAQYRVVDIVADGPDGLVSVELKTSLSRKVIYQAAVNQNFSRESWCAVPTKPRSLDGATRSGLGILRVLGGKVDILLDAVRRDPFPRSQSIVRERLFRMEPGGLAGIQTPYGTGPAQDVARLVAPLYRAGMKWRDIWEQVPNHYCSHKSMAGVMLNYAPARRIVKGGS